MQKIIFLINSLSSGGAEKVLSVLANELVNQKYNIEIIFLEKNEFYELDKRIKKTYLSVFNGKENGIKKLLFLPILAWRLKKYIQNNDIKLIQSHVFRANYVNVLAKIFGANHQAQLVTAGRISRYKEESLIGKINLFLIKNLYKKADLLIYKSKGMMNDANKLFNFKNKSIVINNPYDIKKIKELFNEKVNDFVFKENKIYLVSVGRLISLKRNQDLIKSLKYLPQNIEIIFLGEGNEKENLLNLTKQLNVEKRVHFLGRVLNPYKYMVESDIFVSCSESEGFPNVLVEAMICGLPVISSDCLSGPREILAPNTNINKQLKKGDDIEVAKYGILYPVGDVEKLVKAINLLIENKDLRKKYAELGLKRAKDFSIDKIVEQYKKVLLNG